MGKEKPLVDKDYQLQKFPGKGGWTYASIPEVLQDRHTYFGWVKVRGSIDGHKFSCFRLMPMGNGTLFFPVKAQIRKAIGKGEGDLVRIVLFKDELPYEAPKEFMLCMEDEPLAKENYLKMNEGEQKACIEWIYSAKKEETKVNRMAKVINNLAAGKGFYY